MSKLLKWTYDKYILLPEKNDRYNLLCMAKG